MIQRTASQPAEPATTASPSARSRSSLRAVRLAAALAAGLTAAALAGCGGPAASHSGGSGGSGGSCGGTKTDGGLTVTLSAAPCPLQGGKAGTASISVKDGSGKAVQGATVKVNSEMASMKMKGGDQSATASGDSYQTKLVLGMPGDWKVTVQVDTGTGSASSTEFDLTAK